MRCYNSQQDGVFVAQDGQEDGGGKDRCTFNVISTPQTEQGSHRQVVHLGGGVGGGRECRWRVGRMQGKDW